MERHDIDPPLPACRAQYLVGYLHEIGPVKAGAAGAVAIDHADIRYWQDNVGIVLHPWQARLMRDLSRAYASESHRARKYDCPAPYIERTADDMHRQAKVDSGIKSALRSLVSPPAKR